MKLVLVSHGETRAGGNDGQADVLSELGRRQARAIGQEIAAGVKGAGLPREAVAAVEAAGGLLREAVFTSPRPAAAETAREIAAQLDSTEPVAAGELAGRGSDPGPEESRDLMSVQERTWAWIESLKERCEPDATVVLVSDQATVRALVSRALNLPAGETQRFALDTASITTIEFRGQRTLLGSLNEVCHLEQ